MEHELCQIVMPALPDQDAKLSHCLFCNITDWKYSIKCKFQFSRPLKWFYKLFLEHHTQEWWPQLTTGFDLPDVVTGEPARLAIERSLPPTSLLLPRHEDRVAFIEWQFVLIVLLEVVAGLHHLLPASTVLRHLLWEGLSRDGQQQHKHK